MKTALSSVASLLLGVTLLPVVLAGGDPPPLGVCGEPSAFVAVILETIRTLESSGNYTAQAAGSSASGAYQFLDTTWNGYRGYTHAASAPPAIQDAKAAQHVTEILDGHDGDVTAAPVVWYIGHLPAGGSPEWDTVPFPSAGNRLTPRQYQTKWMTTYNALLTDEEATQPTTPGATVSTAAPGGCTGGSIPALAGGWSLPGPRALIDANPAALDNPHHDYPAWDWAIPVNTPVYAVRGGRVDNVHTWSHNWWDAGCGTNGGNDCDTCGVGLTIISSDDTRWTYCHGTNLTTAVGSTIEPGQQIMWSGNTGRSSGPHLHLEIRAEGIQRCPQPLMASLYERGVGLGPADLPTTEGCSS